MFVRKSVHDRLLDEAVSSERASSAAIWKPTVTNLETQITGLKAMLSAEEGISASLRDEINDKAPLYDLGVREQAQRDKDTANKKAKREAVKAAAANVPVKSK